MSLKQKIKDFHSNFQVKQVNAKVIFSREIKNLDLKFKKIDCKSKAYRILNDESCTSRDKRRLEKYLTNYILRAIQSKVIKKKFEYHYFEDINSSHYGYIRTVLDMDRIDFNRNINENQFQIFPFKSYEEVNGLRSVIGIFLIDNCLCYLNLCRELSVYEQLLVDDFRSRNITKLEYQGTSINNPIKQKHTTIKFVTNELGRTIIKYFNKDKSYSTPNSITQHLNQNANKVGGSVASHESSRDFKEKYKVYRLLKEQESSDILAVDDSKISSHLSDGKVILDEVIPENGSCKNKNATETHSNLNRFNDKVNDYADPLIAGEEKIPHIYHPEISKSKLYQQKNAIRYSRCSPSSSPTQPSEKPERNQIQADAKVTLDRPLQNHKYHRIKRDIKLDQVHTSQCTHKHKQVKDLIKYDTSRNVHIGSSKSTHNYKRDPTNGVICGRIERKPTRGSSKENPPQSSESSGRKPKKDGASKALCAHQSPSNRKIENLLNSKTIEVHPSQRRYKVERTTIQKDAKSIPTPRTQPDRTPVKKSTF